MRVSASMESLWRYIESLSLSERNRQWLAEAGRTSSAREVLEELRHEL